MIKIHVMGKILKLNRVKVEPVNSILFQKKDPLLHLDNAKLSELLSGKVGLSLEILPKNFLVSIRTSSEKNCVNVYAGSIRIAQITGLKKSSWPVNNSLANEFYKIVRDDIKQNAKVA